MSNVLRNIPSMNELLESPPLQKMVERANRTTVVRGVRRFLDNMRTEAKAATADFHVPSPTELAERIAQWINAEQTINLRPVVNATGILLHTGLGRAPWAPSAVDAIGQIARGYSSVEVQVESGSRSQRSADAEGLLRDLTGAEAAAVVNNNAGATLLTLAALAAGNEVVVSRGQLVEIGGSYRLPEVMEFSGARLREVGTTNKTRASDYQQAINEKTAALMRVHTSNYAIVGFTEETSLADMADVARENELLLIDDIGSGAVRDLSRYGVVGEPVISDSLEAGADIVLFSGDKLLGGPQCGLILGRKELVAKIMAHPLMRALRVDKVTLAALVETLRLHQDLDAAEQGIPLMTLLSTPIANLQNRAERLAPQLAACEAIAEACVVESAAQLGGGSVPAQEIPTWCVALTPTKGNVDSLSQALRVGTPSVFGRVQKDRFLLDLRSVLASQDMQLVAAVERLSEEESSAKSE